MKSPFKRRSKGADTDPVDGNEATLDEAVESSETSLPEVDEDPNIEDDYSVIDSSEEIDAALAEVEYTESEEFPLLQQVLLRYFRDLGPSFRRRDVAFVKKYQKYGESITEFDGLGEELTQAFKFPKRSTPMLNEALDTEFTPAAVSRMLRELHDQIGERGEYSQEARDEAREEAKVDPKELMDSYLLRKVNPLPGPLRKYVFPVWQPWAGSLAVLAVSVLATTYLDIPDWLMALPVSLMALSLVVMGLTSLAMRTMRDEVVKPDQEKDREDILKRAREKRIERQARNERLRKIIGM